MSNKLRKFKKKSMAFYSKYYKRRGCKLYFRTGRDIQQNSYSISQLQDIVTTWWLDGDSLVTIANCQQHGDWAANGSVVTVLLAVVNGDYTVTVKSTCSHNAAQELME